MPSAGKCLAGIVMNCSALRRCLSSACCVKTAVKHFTGQVTGTSFIVSSVACRLRAGSKYGAGRKKAAKFSRGL